MEDHAESSRLRKLELTAAGFVALLAICAHSLRVLYAGALWRDEVGALGVATLPSLREMWEQFPHDSFPLAAPLALRLFTHVAGDGDQAWRWLGMAIGLAVAGALWASSRLAGRNLPLLSLALVTGSAPFVVFGDAVRGYGLGSLGIVLAFAALTRLLARPAAGSATAALLAMLLAVHCLFGNWALVAALCAAALVTALRRGNRRAAVAVLATGAATALTLVPYAGPLRAAGIWSVVTVDAIGLGKIVSKLGTSVGPGGWIWLVLVALALARAARQEARRGGGGPRVAAGVVARRANPANPANPADPANLTEPAEPAIPANPAEDAEGDLRLFAALVIGFAIAAQVLFLDVLSYTLRVWYYLPLIALIAAALEPLAADLFRTSRGRRGRAGLAVLLATALAFQLPQLRARMTNVDLIAGRLSTSAAVQDLVLVSPWQVGISFLRYYRGPARWVTVPPIPDHRFHRYDQLKARLAETDPLAGVIDGARRTLAAGHRVWVVGPLSFPPRGEAAPRLPPAPASPSGWKDTPYILAWSSQLGAFLRDHAASLQTVPVPSPGPVSSYENLSLMVASGWR